MRERLGYLAIGLLIGFLYTHNRIDYYLGLLDGEFQTCYSASMLTGFNEGWAYGREYTERKYRWMTAMCFKGWKESESE